LGQRSRYRSGTNTARPCFNDLDPTCCSASDRRPRLRPCRPLGGARRALHLRLGCRSAGGRGRAGSSRSASSSSAKKPRREIDASAAWIWGASRATATGAARLRPEPRDCDRSRATATGAARLRPEPRDCDPARVGPRDCSRRAARLRRGPRVRIACGVCHFV
jgi:hypothetical protein